MIDKPLKIIIAGGGTGGHLFPGIAIAEEFLKRGKADILFVGAGRSLERDVLGRLGFSFRTIPIEGFRGRGAVGLVNVLLKLPGSMWKAYRIIRSFHPHAVIGVGGYSSGPVVLAAHFMGIRTAVAEQNALPGSTNRILGKFADRIFLTYGETRKWFSQGKAVVTGNPVRAVFLAGAKDLHERGERFTILVFGGSQGARSINRTMLGALPHLGGKSIRIIHQTGDDELGYVSGVYKNYGFDAEVRSFIQDMAAAYREADLVICRAGATSIAEITAMGKAAILIPFPFAVDNHQKKNAEALVRAGAALMIEERKLKGKELAEIIERFYDDRESLRVMEQKSASLSNVGAAADIVDACLALIGDKTGVRSQELI